MKNIITHKKFWLACALSSFAPIYLSGFNSAYAGEQQVRGKTSSVLKADAGQKHQSISNQHAATEEQSDASRQMPDDALTEDSLMYANENGVSIYEAKERLKKQSKINNIIELLETIHGDRLAGAWIEHKPEFKVKIRLKGNQSIDRWMDSMNIDETIPVEFILGAESSKKEALGLIKKAHADLKRSVPDIIGVDYDVKTGDIVVNVKKGLTKGNIGITKALESIRNTNSPAIEKLKSLPMRVEESPFEVSDGHTRGGANISTCTSGFVVRHPSTGTTGYITAGHCSNSQTYFEFGGTSYSTTFIDEIRDADQDVQWHTTTHTEYPHFYASSTSSYRSLTAQKNRGSQSVGNYVCHRGKTTGYSCGYIESKNFQPTYTNACNGVTCNSTWIKVSGDNLKCNKGDSGGPWFLSETAYGLYKGQSSSGNDADDCSWAFYSAPNYFGIDLEFDD